MSPEALAAVIADAVAVATSPLVARIALLEQRQQIVPRDGRDGPVGARGDKGERGESGERGLTGPMGEPGPRGEPGQRGEKGEPGRDGRDVDVVALKAEIALELASMVPEAVRREIASLPGPRDGRDGKDGQDGRSIDPAVVDVMVSAQVERAIKALPVPKDGKDGAPGEPGPRGEKGEKGDPGPQGLPGRDGVPGRDGLPGPSGEKGIDGKDGRDGVDGKDGRDGRDGVDGFGFEDFEEELDLDGRTLIHRYRSGDRLKEFRHTMAWLLDEGIWEAGKVYPKGSAVSRNGSVWFAQCDTKAMPGDGSPDWRLSVKHGRDGKQGPPGPQGEKGLDGKDGRPGRDLTQMDEKGRKW